MLANELYSSKKHKKWNTPDTGGSFRLPARGSDIPGSTLILTCWFHSELLGNMADFSGTSETRLRWPSGTDADLTFIVSPRGANFWPQSDWILLFAGSGVPHPEVIGSRFRPPWALERFCALTEWRFITADTLPGISSSLAFVADVGCPEETDSIFTLHSPDGATAVVVTAWSGAAKWNLGNGDVSSELSSDATLPSWDKAKRVNVSSSELSPSSWARS